MPVKRRPEFIAEVQRLIGEGYTNPEIADLTGKSRATIAIIAQRECGGNTNYRIKKTKHKHLREPVFKYFLNHTLEETMEKFGLSNTEIKSIFTVGYRDPKLKNYRKDSRRKDPWTEEQIREMLKCIGLLNRAEIADRIGRGNARVIKEKLQHVGTKYPKYINGLTLSRFQKLFHQRPTVMILTKAGPGRGKHSATFFKIVPWVWIDDALEIGHLDAAEAIKKWVDAMADFQRSIHGRDVYKSLGEIVPFEQWEIQ